MKITEIFRSISGESVNAGLPAIFIRTYGCPLRCSYCDSMYSVDGGEFTEMSVDYIMDELKKYSCKYVVLTGGEPMIQSDIKDLLRELRLSGYDVEVETCGAIDISEIDCDIVTMDWKCPSSGMNDKMLESNLESLGWDDVVKCVVSTKEDLDEMKRISSMTSAQVFVSPVFGQIEPVEIVNYILDNNLDDVKIQLQLHKIIWDPNKRGV